MKTARLWAGALGIALLSGAAGYLLGAGRHSGESTAAANGSLTPRPGPAARISTAADSQRMDAAALRTRLDAETDPLARFQLALRHLETWMETDPAGALDWLRNQEASSRRNEVIRMAVGQFAESHPQAAAEWCLAHLEGVELQNLLIRISQQWAGSDGRQAAEWFAALPAGTARDAALENLMFHWSSNQPAAAIDFIRQQPVGDPLAPVMRQAAYAGWAKSDPPAAVAASLESSRLHRDPLQFANTLANWATVDPAASANWFLAQTLDPAERAPAVAELAGIFAHQSPTAGLAWIERLPAADQPAALNQLASEWAVSDAPSAARWLANSQGPGLDPASVSRILQGFLHADPEGYRHWRSALPPGTLADAAAATD